MSRIAEGLFSLCGDIRDKKMKLRFDVRRLLNPELFFDSLRLGFCVDSEGEYPSLKYDFINEKLYSESPDVTRTVRGAQKDIIVSGISVSNAIWNDITQQLQDFRMQQIMVFLILPLVLYWLIQESTLQLMELLTL